MRFAFHQTMLNETKGGRIAPRNLTFQKGSDIVYLADGTEKQLLRLNIQMQLLKNVPIQDSRNIEGYTIIGCLSYRNESSSNLFLTITKKENCGSHCKMLELSPERDKMRLRIQALLKETLRLPPISAQMVEIEGKILVTTEFMKYVHIWRPEAYTFQEVHIPCPNSEAPTPFHMGMYGLQFYFCL